MTHYIAGIDVGNGYTKAEIGKDHRILLTPSTAAKRFNPGLEIPLTDEEELAAFMKNPMNQIDLSFQTPLVKDPVRRIFGDRALKSGESLEQFDVYAGAQSKAEVDLSGVMLLATLTAYALKTHYESKKALPKKLDFTVTLATALPIGEYAKHHKAYKEKILNNHQPHTVTIHNFQTPIPVNITFTKVHVASEGEAAQYGMIFSNEAFLQTLAEEAKASWDGNELEDITGRDIVQSQNSLGIDIGEGTMDFAVFSNGRFNRDASSMMAQGYGNVLERALEKLQVDGYPYHSRKELAEFLALTPGPLARARYNSVHQTVMAEAERFSDVVVNEVSKVFDRVGGFIEVMYVYGGGATPLRPSLLTKLKAKIRSFGPQQMLPIVYLSSEYSQYLNMQGVYQLANELDKRP